MRPYIDHAIGIVPMLFQMLEELETSVLCQISIMLWSVWWKRNQVCWQGKTPTTYDIDVQRRAREQYNDWIKAGPVLRGCKQCFRSGPQNIMGLFFFFWPIK
jgi:hypothetical protein